MNLEKARKEIDKIDNSILDLIKQRLSIVSEIGAWKKREGIEVFDREREDRMLLELEKKAEGNNLDTQFIRGIWDLILDNSRKSQEKIKGKQD